MITRQQQLFHWLEQETGVAAPDLTDVAGDASFRHYYRLHLPDRSLIVMDAPPTHENCSPFVRIADHWFQHGVAVPKVIAQNIQHGFLLLEDFGDHQLFQSLTHTPDLADSLYRQAIDSLLQIQQTPISDLPLYSYDLLYQEMALFSEWFCKQWLDLKLTDDEHLLLDTTFAHLCYSALQQTQVPVHRDYHSRNLMLTDQGTIGIIDFQDAVCGPITYDLVSLLKDCYLHWSEQQVDHWCSLYLQQAQHTGQLPADITPEAFRRDFDLMGAQRHIKVLGIFSRLWLRDGKAAYLKDIPRTLQHLLEACLRYPELSSFHQWLLARIAPAVQHKQASGAIDNRPVGS